MKSLRIMAALLLVTTLAYSSGKKALDRERQAIAKAEADFEKARAEKGLEGWLSFFADDTADFVRGGPFTFTKEEMRKHLEKTFDPADQLTWKPVQIDVADWKKKKEGSGVVTNPGTPGSGDSTKSPPPEK